MLSSIPEEVKEGFLNWKGMKASDLRSFSYCRGGCINNGGKLSTTDGNYFIKWNFAEKYPGMFMAEHFGLEELRKTNSIRIPSPYIAVDNKEYSFIAMEYIEGAPRNVEYWEKLGIGLAKMHHKSNDIFGFIQDNYIGSLKQVNKTSLDWIDFFRDYRLDFQLQISINKGYFGRPELEKFDILYKNLPELLPIEVPALLHGDLWSGNLITDEKGDPCLIDPAVYYGHREVDLAFTQLFGGFDRRFYEVYRSEFPLLPDYEQRFDIYNLYPLLVHVNLFGGGYMAQVKNILKTYS